MAKQPEIKNRKAFHDYHISDRIEAGIALFGPEVKSLRAGMASLRDAYVQFEHGEAFIVGLSITAYANRGYADHRPLRPRKLLLHRRELKKLQRQSQDKGYTIVPLRVYFTDRGIAKVEIALAQGKRQYDKRATIASRDTEREVQRTIKEMNR